MAEARRSLRGRLIATQVGLLILLIGVLSWRMHAIVMHEQVEENIHSLQVQALLAASALQDPLSGYSREFDRRSPWWEDGDRERHRVHEEGEEGDDDERETEHGRIREVAPVSPDLQRWTEQQSASGGFDVKVFDRHGRPLSGGASKPGPEVEQALDGREASRVTADRAFVAAPVTRGGAVLGAVQLSRSADEAVARARMITASMLLTSLLVLAAASGVVIWTSRRLLEPLESLKKGAEAVATGDMEARVPEGGDDEVAAVSLAFNTMVAALRRGAEQQRAFVANASHELRTPLTNIKLRTEALLRGSLGEQTVTRYLRDIDGESDRLARLASALLDLSRLDHPEPSAPATPINVAPIISATRERMSLAAEAAGLALDEALPPNLPPVAVSDTDLEHVLTNLVDNAVKYTPAGGRITLGASTEAGQVKIWVADTGPGISDDDLPLVFDRFYRADKARSRTRAGEHGSGAGLGLALVRALAERHGGTVMVANRPEGGALLTLTLPAARD